MFRMYGKQKSACVVLLVVIALNVVTTSSVQAQTQTQSDAAAYQQLAELYAEIVRLQAILHERLQAEAVAGSQSGLQLGNAVSNNEDEENQDAELQLASAKADPSHLQIMIDDARTTAQELFAFTLKSTDRDATIAGFTISLDVDGVDKTVPELVDSASLSIDGQPLAEDAYEMSMLDDGIVFTFEELMISQEPTSVVLEMVFKPQATLPVNTTIAPSIHPARIDVAAPNDMTISTKRIIGAEHLLITDGPVLSAVAETVELVTMPGNDIQAQFDIAFTVEALRTDLYVPRQVGGPAAREGVGATYRFFDARTYETVAAVTDVALTSSAITTTAGNYHIPRGKTACFTLTATADPALTGTYQFHLERLYFNTDDTAADRSIEPHPHDAFRSQAMTIPGNE